MNSRAWCSMFNFKGADRHKRLGSAADMPHRIKYRKLTTG